MTLLQGFWLILHSWMFIWSYTTIFFSNVYISVNKIFECSYFFFFGWEIGHSLRTYATGEWRQGHAKCTQVSTGGRKVWKLVIRYVLTKWMVPNICREIFLCIGSAKYTRASPPARKMWLFSSIITTIIYPTW